MGLKSFFFFFFFFLLITFTMKGKVPDCGLSTPRTPSLKINYSPVLNSVPYILHTSNHLAQRVKLITLHTVACSVQINN